jgi:ribosomal protein S18 acetylase RimI-like enzyme
MNNEKAKLTVEILQQLNSIDLEDICDASIETMKETLGFNIGTQYGVMQSRESISSYWEGVLLVPERVLIVGRIDGTIAGSLQIVKPSPNNHISQFSCAIDNYFVAPWARGNGLSDMMLEMAEKEAMRQSFSIIKISVRATREAAIRVFERRNYIKWGTLPKYELDQGKIVAGHFYYKEL